MRPLGLGETLDATFGLVRQHFKALIIVVLVMTIPVEVLSFFISTSTSEVQDGAVVATDDGAYIAGEVVANLLRIVAYLLVTVGCFYILAEGYLGRQRSAGESLRFGAKRGWKVLWITLLVLLGTLGGALLCLLPGIYVAIMWSVALPVLLVEGVSGTKAMGRSWSLVKDRWWPTFGRLIVMYLIASVLGSLLSIVAIAILAAGSDSIVLYALATSLAQLISNLFTTPLVAAVTIVVYFDLRVRKEGFDLAVLAEQMGGAAAGPSPFAQAGAISTPASETAPAPAPSTGTPESGDGFGGFAPPSPPDSPERPG